MARLEEVDNALVHEDSSDYTLSAVHRYDDVPDYEVGDAIQMTARASAGDGATAVMIDFTRQEFREWLELMQEWVAGWPE